MHVLVYEIGFPLKRRLRVKSSATDVPFCPRDLQWPLNDCMFIIFLRYIIHTYTHGNTCHTCLRDCRLLLRTIPLQWILEISHDPRWKHHVENFITLYKVHIKYILNTGKAYIFAPNCLQFQLLGNPIHFCPPQAHAYIHTNINDNKINLDNMKGICMLTFKSLLYIIEIGFYSPVSRAVEQQIEHLGIHNVVENYKDYNYNKSFIRTCLVWAWGWVRWYRAVCACTWEFRGILEWTSELNLPYQPEEGLYKTLNWRYSKY